MTRLEPIDRADLTELEPIFELVESATGFVPTSLHVMARRRSLFDSFAALALSVLGEGPLSEEMRQLVAHVASTAAGCRYCQAHTAAHGISSGADPDRFEQVWEFETSPLFSEAERTMLRFAFHAAQQPSAVVDEEFSQLGQHWSDDEILHAVAVVSLFGFLNRFNAAMATTLEDEPLEVARRHLSGSGWSPEQHAPTPEGETA